MTDIAVTGSRVIIQGSGGCVSQSDPGVTVRGLDIATGRQVWSAGAPGTTSACWCQATPCCPTARLLVAASDGVGVQRHHRSPDLEPRWVRCVPVRHRGRPVRIERQHHDDLRRHLVLEGRSDELDQAGRVDLSARRSQRHHLAKHLCDGPFGQDLRARPHGSLRWTSTEKGAVLAAGPSRLLVTCDSGSICALNRTTGSRAWKATRTSPAVSAILAGDLVYAIPGREPLSANTGQPIPNLTRTSQPLSPFSERVGAGGGWSPHPHHPSQHRCVRRPVTDTRW